MKKLIEISVDAKSDELHASHHVSTDWELDAIAAGVFMLVNDHPSVSDAILSGISAALQKTVPKSLLVSVEKSFFLHVKSLKNKQ